MANDRLYIKHRGTGKRFLIAKCLTDGWYVPGQGAIDATFEAMAAMFMRNLNDWFEGVGDEAGYGQGVMTDLCLETETEAGATVLAKTLNNE